MNYSRNRIIFNKKDLVSVIIPVYNTEEYISECLESVISQTYGLENLEIIIVNDATPDKSMDVINKFINIYNININVIQHTRNKGLGGAKNSGLMVARGEYLMFLDSDDFLHTEYIANGVDLIKRENVDILITKIRTFPKNIATNPSQRLCNNIRIAAHTFATFPTIIHATGTNKIYKRSILKELYFSENRYYEDIIFFFENLKRSKAFYLTNKIEYNYRININSITNSPKTIKHLEDHLFALEFIKKYSRKSNLQYMVDWFCMRSLPALLPILKNVNIEKGEIIFKKIKNLYSNMTPYSTINHEISKRAQDICYNIKKSKNLSHII